MNYDIARCKGNESLVCKCCKRRTEKGHPTSQLMTSPLAYKKTCPLFISPKKGSKNGK